jgi:hypothetical protein
MFVNCRDFLRGVAGTSGAAVAGSLLGEHILADSSTRPTPAESGIQHIVVTHTSRCARKKAGPSTALAFAPLQSDERVSLEF